MTSRCSWRPTRGSRGDWRALAGDRPPCPPDPSTSPADDEHDIELHLRGSGNITPVVTLTGAMTIGDPAQLRALVPRLYSAVDALKHYAS